MKNILLNLNADLGMDCMGCGHSFDDGPENLEERYGLGTDISDLDFSWSVSLED